MLSGRAPHFWGGSSPPSGRSFVAHFAGMDRALRSYGRNLGRQETIPNTRVAFVFALSTIPRGATGLLRWNRCKYAVGVWVRSDFPWRSDCWRARVAL